MSARILVVDDHPETRTTVRSLLKWHSLHVCGEAENGRQAIEKVKQLNPDLVLLDISMPVMDGIQAAYKIRRISRSTKILFFTIHDSADLLAGVLLFADASVPKSDAGTKLIPALKRLLQADS